jgi:hypothetical protein
MSYIYYKAATLYGVTDYVWQRAELGSSYLIMEVQNTVYLAPQWLRRFPDSNFQMVIISGA